jgi:kynureninase
VGIEEQAVGSVELGPFPKVAGYEAAAALDAADHLRPLADRFVPIDTDLIYLDGNSLGRLPAATVAHLQSVVDQEWGAGLVRSWPDRWWDLADTIGSKIAPLVGAGPAEVIVTDSTTVAILKLTVAALKARPHRTRIVTDDLNFPTDVYATRAAADLAGGREIDIVPSVDAVHGPVDDIIAALDEDTALLTLTHVAFKSGYRYDMERLTRAAHDVGALVLWDLSHSVGAVPIDLDRAGADLAVGCTYKYLNGGPGSPAFLYVNERVAPGIDNPFSGWWGHERPFAFDLDYTPAPSIRRFQTGTMPILSLAAVETGVALTTEAGIEDLRAKSIGLSEFFIEQSYLHLEPLGFELASPRSAEQRGSHISLRHPDGWRIVQAMIEHAAIIPDFRDPDNLRFGLTPLSTSYTDVHTAIIRIRELMSAGLHLTSSNDRASVT